MNNYSVEIEGVNVGHTSSEDLPEIDVVLLSGGYTNHGDGEYSNSNGDTVNVKPCEYVYPQDLRHMI